MVGHWQTRFSILLLGLLAPCLVSAENSFENTAIVRTVELGGSQVNVVTTYAVKALEDGSSIYTIAIAEKEHSKTSWLQAKVKGQTVPLQLEHFGFNTHSAAHLYVVELPKVLKTNGTTTIILESVQTHATYAWPQEATQKDSQSLKYDADLFVLSPYHTAVQRTKIRSPSPQIHSYTEPKEMAAYTADAPVVKSGATLTYGPYTNIPASSNEDFVEKKQKQISVHYGYDHPILEVTKLERSAEISHWGANLNIQDNIWLHNAGPRLKGHFSRLEFQSQNYFGRLAPHTLSSMALHLPPGIHNVYYYDLNGNVSTSRLRPAPSVPKGAQSHQYSVLEMRPRYPLMGGWNYTFTLGWDSPLEDYAGWDRQNGRYIVGIPIQTLIPGAVVNEAELKIILPEGATDIQFYPPFPSVMNSVSTHVSYLDTTGRPAISLLYHQLTEKHTGTIYVSYKVPLSAHFKKPFAVATALSGLFIFAFVWRRVDTRLQK